MSDTSTLTSVAEKTLTDPRFLFLNHDRLLGSRYRRLGGGATVALTDSIDLDAAFVRFLAGPIRMTASASPSEPRGGLRRLFKPTL